MLISIYYRNAYTNLLQKTVPNMNAEPVFFILAISQKQNIIAKRNKMHFNVKR